MAENNQEPSNYSTPLSLHNEYFEEDIKTENDEEEKQNLNFRNHLCNICQKVYKSKASRSTHIKSAHEERSYPCDQCQYKARAKGNLKSHIQSVHAESSILVINVANN